MNYRRDQEAAGATVAAIEAAGGVARAYQASVDGAEQDARMVDAVVADLRRSTSWSTTAASASRATRSPTRTPPRWPRVLGTHAVGPTTCAGSSCRPCAPGPGATS